MDRARRAEASAFVEPGRPEGGAGPPGPHDLLRFLAQFNSPSVPEAAEDSAPRALPYLEEYGWTTDDGYRPSPQVVCVNRDPETGTHYCSYPPATDPHGSRRCGGVQAVLEHQGSRTEGTGGCGQEEPNAGPAGLQARNAVAGSAAIAGRLGESAGRPAQGPLLADRLATVSVLSGIGSLLFFPLSIVGLVCAALSFGTIRSRGSTTGTSRWRAGAVTSLVLGPLGFLVFLAVMNASWLPGILGGDAAGPAPQVLFARPPAPGFTVLVGAQFAGYLSSYQFAELDGAPPPRGMKAYARTWTDPARSTTVIEIAMLTPDVRAAQQSVDGFAASFQAEGGQTVPVRRLGGADAYLAVLPASPATDSREQTWTVVARAAVGLAFGAVGPDEAADRSVVEHLAQTSDAAWKPDPARPAATYDPRLGRAYRTLALLGALLLGLTVTAGGLQLFRLLTRRVTAGLEI